MKTPIALVVVRGGCAELYCTYDVYSVNVDIDNIVVGDPKPRIHYTKDMEALVRIAGIEKYIKWIPEVK
jgi:hypothetical protein